MRHRPVLILFMLIFFTFPVLTGFAADKRPRLRILTSFLPVYILTQNVIQGIPGTSAELMLPPGAGCPHHYRLTANDLKRIAASDVMVINGLDMEEFMGKPVQSANPHLKIIDSSKGIVPLYLTEDGSRKPNPHIWMSPSLAARQADNIAASLAALDKAHAAAYRNNAAGYQIRLRQLDFTFRKAGERLRNKKVIAFHGVFDYLARDLGIIISAYIENTEGQTPSARELNRLVNLIKRERVQAIFIESQEQARVAETLKRETGVPVYLLDPVTSVNHPVGPDYYEKVMQKNLAVLQKALK